MKQTDAEVWFRSAEAAQAAGFSAPDAEDNASEAAGDSGDTPA